MAGQPNTTRNPKLVIEPSDVVAAQAGDVDARERVCLRCRPLIVKMGRRYPSLSREDAIQSGMVGVLLALDRYNPVKASRFVTYAIYWIRKEIRNFCDIQKEIISIPDYLKTPSGIAKTVRRPNGIKCIEKASLARQVNGSSENSYLNDCLDHRESREDQEDREDRTHRLDQAIAFLSPVERFVIEHRYGMYGPAKSSRVHIASVLGIDQRKVRKIERTALAALRLLLTDEGLCDPLI